MPIKPKRYSPRPLQQLRAKAVPDKYCENPKCGAKLDREKARKGYKYCDRTCRWEHDRVLALERRPKDVRCAFCGKEIDTMRANPSAWTKSEKHFCDDICTDGYRRQHGFYQQMSKKGNEKAKEYKEKHGQMLSYQDRAKAVSKNNRERPPKAKHFIREGRVWGYDVKFYPHEDGQSYRVSVPELDEEIGVLTASTKKAGLKLVRERILELRAEEAKGENRN